MINRIKKKGFKEIVKLEFLTFPVHHRSRQIIAKGIPNEFIAQKR